MRRLFNGQQRRDISQYSSHYVSLFLYHLPGLYLDLSKDYRKPTSSKMAVWKPHSLRILIFTDGLPSITELFEHLIPFGSKFFS